MNLDFWKQSDRVALRNYIAQHPNFAKALQEVMPQTTGTTMEEAALTGMKRAGAEEIIGKIAGQLCEDESRMVEKTPFIDGRGDT